MELFISLISLAVAVIIGIIQVKQSNRLEAFEKRQDARDEKRHNDVICAEATRFIQKYSEDGYEADIFLLPLCIAAYQYNPTYPYRREIYREFCGLTEDVQNTILSRCHIDTLCHENDQYYNLCLEKLLSEIEKYCPNDKDLFYDGGKYLERALLNHGKKAVPNIRCAIDVRERELLDSPFMKHTKSANRTDMDYKQHIANLLTDEADKLPISRLAEEPTSLGVPVDMHTDEILICYLCCVIAECIPSCCSQNQTIYENMGSACDYSGQWYMEDMFLNALHSITVYGTPTDKKVSSND